MARQRIFGFACQVMAILLSTHTSVDAQSFIQQFDFTEGSPTGLAMSGGDLIVGAGTTVYTVSTLGRVKESYPVSSNAGGLSLQGANLLVTKSNGAAVYALPNVTPTSGGITVMNLPDPTGVAYESSTDLYYLSMANAVRAYNSFGNVVGGCMLVSTFDSITGLTTTGTAGQMYAVGSGGLYSLHVSGNNCSLSSPSAFPSFTDPQAITHVPGTNNVWVAFSDGKIAEFSVGFGSSFGLAGRTTLQLEPDHFLVMDWRTSEQEGSIEASDLTDLRFTWLQNGATRFQDDAIVNSVAQPIGGVPRGLDDIRFNFDLNSMMLTGGASSDASWDNDFNSLQSGNAVGETFRFEGAFTPSQTAVFTRFLDGVEDTSTTFTTFSQSTVIVPEPSSLACGLIVALAGWAAAVRRTRIASR